MIWKVDERNFREISIYNLSYKTDIKSREIYILVLYLWFYCKDSHILITYEVHTKFFLHHRTFENNVFSKSDIFMKLVFRVITVLKPMPLMSPHPSIAWFMVPSEALLQIESWLNTITLGEPGKSSHFLYSSTIFWVSIIYWCIILFRLEND